MLNATKFYYLILLISQTAFFVSCNPKANIETTNKYYIISLLIDKHTVPILVPPPPPPPGIIDTLALERDSIIKLNKSDNWRNQKQIVAINTKLRNVNGNDIPRCDTIITKEYSFIFNKFLNDELPPPLVIQKIKPTRGNVFIECRDNESLRNNSDFWKTFDCIVSFSDVKFSDDLTKAVVYMGISYGKLNGWSAYFLLEKINEKWIIKHSKTFEVS